MSDGRVVEKRNEDVEEYRMDEMMLMTNEMKLKQREWRIEKQRDKTRDKIPGGLLRGQGDKERESLDLTSQEPAKIR